MAQGIREILDSREREIVRIIDDIKRKQLVPLELELADVRKAREAIGLAPTEGKMALHLVGAGELNASSEFQRMTVRQLAQKALNEHFKQGATYSELLKFFRREWGREIGKGSLSPQLSRMRKDGIVRTEGNTWILELGIAKV
jgi:hypothetical protein